MRMLKKMDVQQNLPVKICVRKGKKRIFVHTICVGRFFGPKESKPGRTIKNRGVLWDEKWVSLTVFLLKLCSS